MPVSDQGLDPLLLRYGGAVAKKQNYKDKAKE